MNKLSDFEKKALSVEAAAQKIEQKEANIEASAGGRAVEPVEEVVVEETVVDHPRLF